MEQEQKKPFSGAVSILHGRMMPEAAIPVGYAALIHSFELRVPVRLTLSANALQPDKNKELVGGCCVGDVDLVAKPHIVS